MRFCDAQARARFAACLCLWPIDDPEVLSASGARNRVRLPDSGQGNGRISRISGLLSVARISDFSLPVLPTGADVVDPTFALCSSSLERGRPHVPAIHFTGGPGPSAVPLGPDTRRSESSLKPASPVRTAVPPARRPPKLLDRVREAIRTRHYSRRTEEAYVGWIRRFIFFHAKRHPAEMGKPEIERFLTALAVER
ncbi:MAG: phage integrase N-terminal SAM-like domain-containing protein, partial [Candidatus Binatia bacterium]